MASSVDLNSQEGISAFRRDCEIPNDVEVRPYIEGEEVTFPSVLISSYLLLIVGLRFPLSASFCDLLEGLRIPLFKCRPNLARLLWGISLVNQRLGILLRSIDVVRCYVLSVNRGELSLRANAEGMHLVRDVDFDNRDWGQYPWVIISGNWIEDPSLSPPSSYDIKLCRVAFDAFRSIARTVANSEAIDRAVAAGLRFSDLSGRHAGEVGGEVPPADPVVGAPGSRRYTRSMATGTWRPTGRAPPEGPISLSTSAGSSSSSDAGPPPGPSRKGKEKAVEDEPLPKRSRSEVQFSPPLPRTWTGLALANMEERLQATEKQVALLETSSLMMDVDFHALELTVEELVAKVAALKEEVAVLKGKGP